MWYDFLVTVCEYLLYFFTRDFQKLLRDIRDEVASPSIESCPSNYEKTDKNKLNTVQSVQSLVCKEKSHVEQNSQVQVTACKSQIQQLIQAVQCVNKQGESKTKSITETSNEVS